MTVPAHTAAAGAGIQSAWFLPAYVRAGTASVSRRHLSA